jgi:hypothetical protein
MPPAKYRQMLTDIHVSSAKAKGKSYKLSDGGGLYLHVTVIRLAAIPNLIEASSRR